MIKNKTKIVCTIGPASESVETLKQLIESGMNVARLNFSHGDHEEHRNRIRNIRQAAEETGRSVAIMLDTKGPEIRTGPFKGGQAYLEEGSTVYLTMEDVEGTAERFSLTYSGLIHDVHPGSKILLDDGLIGLEVKAIHEDKKEIETVVQNSGEIKNKKGVNVPNVSVNLPGITDKDAEDILFGIEEGIDFIAASFVRRASDVLDIRELLEKNNGEFIQIVPKIENREGVNNIAQILQVSNGIMVARGDLGVEIPAEEVPFVQKKLIHECNVAAKPVITATQMLDSMQRNPRPTRAEASDVANAIYDGTDAIMLSGETAAGDYPVESVETMYNIAVYTENKISQLDSSSNRFKNEDKNMTDAISHSVANLTEELELNAIVTPTESGNTARMISKYRPNAPIIAITFRESVNRQLNLVWGVHPINGERVNSTDEMLGLAVSRSLDSGYIQRGDRIVITAGVPVGQSGSTNLVKVHVVGDIVQKGQGIGDKGTSGKVIIAENAKQLEENFEDGDIIVATGTEKEMMPWIKRAAGIITEEGGLTSHAAIVGLNLELPTIVGAKEVTSLLTNGDEITLDSETGNIYLGRTSII